MHAGDGSVRGGMPVATEQQRAWASSGAMALTGRPGGPPLVPPDGLVDRIRLLGAPLGLDPLPLLAERAAIAGLRRGGAVSCGGATRLLRAADGWIAVSLARPDDVAAVAAWLELDRDPEDPWTAVAEAVTRMPAATAVERGILLDLPIAAVPDPAAGEAIATRRVEAGPVQAWPAPADGFAGGQGRDRAVAHEAGAGQADASGGTMARDARTAGAAPPWSGRPASPTAAGGGSSGSADPLARIAGGAPGALVPGWGEADDAVPVRAEHLGDGDGDGPGRVGRPLVVDLSSLWAGPLCGRLLQERGARVVKVESVGRPDGARTGPPAFFDLLHQGQEMVALDLGDPGDVERLRRLLRAADVVIEASRPRALEQLGIDARALASADDGPAVWVSITGHGRHGPARNRVAFGDDAAAAGGLVAWDGNEDGPCFVADAVADPLTGVAAAAAATRALAAGGHWLLDVAMTRVAAFVAAAAGGQPWHPGTDADALPPQAPPPPSQAAALGAHTEPVLATLR